MIRKLYSILVIVLLSNVSMLSQISNVKLNHDVYDYLSILAQKGIIEYNDLVKPLPRRYVAEKLIEAESRKSDLTKLQKEELQFYKAEFGYEIERINSEFNLSARDVDVDLPEFKNDNITGEFENQDPAPKKVRDLTDKSWEFEVRNPADINSENVEKVVNHEIKLSKKEETYTFIEYDPYSRWRVFAYQNDLMNLNVNPILGYEIANWEKKNYRSLFAGINFNGEIGGILGFNFELRTLRLEPGSIRSNFLFNQFSPETTINAQLADRERIEASSIKVDIGAKWEWGSITIGKNHLNWGYAENGKIVLSEKAPSFPYIRLDLSPTEWLTFNYIHAWLNSDVVDTSSFHASWRYRVEWENTDKFSYIGKYMAMHSVTFKFWDGFNLSIGESAVYSGNLRLSYLIPIMFFDLADEYISRDNNYAGASTQLFLSASSRNHIPNTHLYASFHADELTPEGLFDPATQYYKMAFTFGGSVVDLPIPNLGVRLEYTKVYPGNYRHFVPSLTYESSSSLMGHWMGDNGDLFYAAVDYTIFRGLKVKLWTQHIRKGTEALGNRAYKVQIPQPGFLFTDNISDRKNYGYYGINVDYEFMHDVWMRAHYQYIDYEKQIVKDEFKSVLYRDLSLAIGYGI